MGPNIEPDKGKSVELTLTHCMYIYPCGSSLISHKRSSRLLVFVFAI